MSMHDAVTRLQAIALASTDITIKAAPDYPISDAAVAPFCIAYIGAATVSADDATSARYLVNLNVDFYTSMQLLKDTFAKHDAFVMEYGRRLAGDPTLAGYVDTIVFPVEISEPVPGAWNGVDFMRRRVTVRVKDLLDPITT